MIPEVHDRDTHNPWNYWDYIHDLAAGMHQLSIV